MISSRRMRSAGQVALLGRRLLAGERLVNMKMDLREVGWGGVDWVGLAKDGDRWRALTNTAINFRLL
jgi:hypothetical protein